MKNNNTLTYELTEEGTAQDGRKILVKLEHYKDSIKNMDGQDLHARLIFTEKESNLRLGEFLLLEVPEDEAKVALKETATINLDEYLKCL